MLNVQIKGRHDEPHDYHMTKHNMYSAEQTLIQNTFREIGATVNACR